MYQVAKFVRAASTHPQRKKWINQSSLAFIAIISATLGFSTQSLAAYFYGAGYRSDDPRGYSTSLALIQVPNKTLSQDNEYIRGLTELNDTETGVYMNAGPIEIRLGGVTRYHPSAEWRTVTEGRRRYTDTTVNLRSAGWYDFKVNYAGNGAWQAQVVLPDGSEPVIYLKQLYLSRPMKVVSSGAEAQYSSPGKGYYTTTTDNVYRVGGTNNLYKWIYNASTRNNTSVTVSSPLGDPYYEWFVTGP